MFAIGSFPANDCLTVASLCSSYKAVKAELYEQAFTKFPIQGLKTEQIINFDKSKQRLTPRREMLKCILNIRHVI